MTLEDYHPVANLSRMEASLDEWPVEQLLDAVSATDAALADLTDLEGVHDVLAKIPPSFMCAVGLGAWRRCVLDILYEPGPGACAGYLRVLSDVLHEAAAYKL